MRLFLCLIFSIALTHAQTAEPLRLVATVPLPAVQGRIDHMAMDVKGQRLFVAALGNNTLEVIDVKNNQLLHTISGLREPQGMGYVPDVNRIFAANRADGSLRMFDGASYAPLKTIPYGEDADNVRVDARDHHIWVGYGSGALSMLGEDGAKLGNIPLDVHPESFQLEMNGPRIFVNLPDAHKISVVDRDTQKIVATWTTGSPQENFPMALDEPEHRLFVVCRRPARLVVLDTSNGRVVASLPAVGDCDDVFYDAARKRIYASGGAGAISVFEERDAGHYSELAKIATRSGARTSFFSPDLGRLFLAVRRQGSNPAEIRVYEAH